MIKKDAKDMRFEDFKNALTPELLHELAKMHIPYLKAYNIFQDILEESLLDDEDDMGTMESIVRNIILDYTEEV
ncbi:MAG TPA: hypothetical protein GX396_05300 [Tissierellia bacterium]|nr:hypothetical protein [Tissierellia bacterium]